MRHCTRLFQDLTVNLPRLCVHMWMLVLYTGVLDTSLTWVAGGITGSQAFAAWDRGFDVWLGTTRSNPPHEAAGRGGRMMACCVRSKLRWLTQKHKCAACSW